MRLLHTADLHLGKVIHEFSMLEDQRIILNQIITIAEEEKVDGIILAGDIYDRAIPTREAVLLLDDFLTRLTEAGKQIYMINGNHDSGERLSFVSGLLEKRGLHIAGMLGEGCEKAEFQDEYGPISLYLMPFVKPAQVREWAGVEEENFFYQREVEELLKASPVDRTRRNILVAHHFVTNAGKEPELSDSDSRVQVGGTDNVDVSLFHEFDYTALGHIHRPQQIGDRPVYYAGSPLKYSFSESGQQKQVYLVELKEKGSVTVTSRFLFPIHDMRKIKGRLEELISPEIVGQADARDYLSVTLTNQEELLDPIQTLRAVYPNVMQLILEKNQVMTDRSFLSAEQVKEKTSLELFEEFYRLVRGVEPDAERKQVLEEALKQLEEEKCAH